MATNLRYIVFCVDELSLLPEADAGTVGYSRRSSPRPAARPRATIRVVLADDQAVVLAGLRALLEATADIAVVGEARTGQEAARLTARLRPDVVLLDARLPEPDAIATTRLITSRPAPLGGRVLLRTTNELDDTLFEALLAGASGFLAKDIEPEDLLRAVRVVAGGSCLLSPDATRRLIDEFVAGAYRRRPAPHLDVLTDRERQVMALVGRGRSNEEIARLLVLSPTTVKTHVSRTMTKLEARDRAQLVAFAYETGLLDVPRTGGGPVSRS